MGVGVGLGAARMFPLSEVTLKAGRVIWVFAVTGRQNAAAVDCSPLKFPDTFTPLTATLTDLLTAALLMMTSPSLPLMSSRKATT